MMRTLKNLAFTITVVFAALSCNSYLLGGKKPMLSNCCSFNTTTLELRLTCKDEHIYFVKSFIAGAATNGSYNDLWNFSKRYEEGTSSVLIPIPGDSAVRNKTVLIKVWRAGQVIEDYYFKLEPADWKAGKLLFGELSVR